MKKVLVVFVIMVAMFMVPAPAYADSRTINECGNYDISTFGDGSVININGGLEVKLTDIYGGGGNGKSIVCGAGVTLTLSGINLHTSCPLVFNGSGNTLILEGENTINGENSGGYNQPGVKVESGTSLEISGTGELNATGGDCGAGIGSEAGYNCGMITIKGGTVHANGGDNSAGIGGGYGGNGGSITIEGGTVIAIGGSGGAGIGGGESCAGEGGNGGSISIKNGQVGATGKGGAGIGGGIGGAGGEITIEGGTVTAHGGGAGIGGGSGYGSDGGTIIVKNGEINAWGGVASAGIGGGSYGNGGEITIKGGTINAWGGADGGAGIGGGESGNGGEITIQDGTVSAQGGNFGAGIGGGDGGDSGTINIISGQVTATGGGGGAGIGGGMAGIGNTIIIENGTVKATGGDDGAGIGSGSGYGVSGCTITIKNGQVTATGGIESAGIGGGYYGTGGTITISGGIVYAKRGSSAPLDIGYGISGSGGTLQITGDTAVLLKNDTCITPETSHTHITVNSVASGKVYGIGTKEWTPPFGVYIIPYTLRYNINNGTGTVADALEQHINTSTIITGGEGLSLNGRAFLHWNTAADGSGTSYSEDSEFVFTENTTLYAQYVGIFTRGDGSESDPYGISTPGQLNAVRDYPDAHFIMLNDIDMSAATSQGGEYWNSGAGWEPIAELNGSFDGASHSITGLKIHRTEADNAGLFDLINNGGTVEHLGMVDCNIYGGDKRAGSICARNYGTIELCYNTGRVTGGDISITGGIAGVVGSSGLISKCYNSGTVDVYQTTYSGAASSGGVAGGVYSSGIAISDCYNIGIVNGESDVGGIVGSGNFRIQNCYSLNNSGYALIGSASGTYMDCGGLYFFKTCSYKKGSEANVFDDNTEYGTALTDEEMQYAVSFAGYDFDNVWTMGQDASYPYPELQGMPQVDLPENTIDFSGGNGYPYNPFIIESSEQLNNIRNFGWGCFKLMNNIDLSGATSEGGTYYNSGHGFEPIAFYGVFNGNGFYIKGLKISRGKNPAGLFTSGYSLITDLDLINADILGNDAGGIVSSGYGTEITNCSVSGFVRSYDYYGAAGGIAGKLQNGGIFYCSNDADVGSYGWAQGGILGASQGSTVSRCYNTGTIAAGGMNTRAGGICGANSNLGLISECYNAGHAVQSSIYNNGVGGIAGVNDASIIQCYNVGYVTNPITKSTHGITGCYYLDNGGEAVPGANAETDLEMQQQASFENFDFDTVWTMGGDPRYPYPELQSNTHIWVRPGAVAFAGGSGTLDDPYQVSTPEQLNEIRYNRGMSFTLINDIDMTTVTSIGGDYYNSGAGWEPIRYFYGVLNGNGHKILGLNIDRPEEENIGLIGKLLNGGKIHNLEISNASIAGLNNTGAFVGFNEGGAIENCINRADVSIRIPGSKIETCYVGGIVGYNEEETVITHCENDGHIVMNSENRDGYAGGITGNNGLTSLSYCTNNGTVEANMTNQNYNTFIYAGGIAATGSGNITYSNNHGEIHADGIVGGIIAEKSGGEVQYCNNYSLVESRANYNHITGVAGGISGRGGNISHCGNFGRIIGDEGVGGITGSGGNIEYCYNTGTVEANLRAGGITGINWSSSVSKCYNAGSIDSDCYSGGIAGENDRIIRDCYNVGNINSKWYSGGIAGNFNDSAAVLFDCYSTGYISSADKTPYGIIGTRNYGDAHECFYCNAKQGIGIARLGGSFTNVDYKSYDELRQQATFINFDFTNTWEIVEGQRFPVLKGMPFIYTSGILLSQDTTNLNTGDTVTLNATVNPDDATNKNIEWLSSNTDIATVAAGVITAKGPGVVTISVKTVDGGFIDTCEVTVIQPVTGITLNENTLSMRAGVINTTLNAVVKPNNATNKNVSWSSNNEAVATVDQSGYITGVSKGEAVITVTTEDGGFTDTCELTVIQPVESVTISGKPSIINIGNTFTLTANILPSDASYPQVTWSSNKEDVATVDQTGKVTVVGTGDVVITAATIYGKSDTCNITVTPRPFTVTFIYNGAGNAVEVPVDEDSLIPEPGKPEKTGYDFGGWYTDNDTFQFKWNFEWGAMPDRGLALYAKWSPITYTVRYNGNGGEGSMDDNIFTYDQSAQLGSNIYTRTGYAFSGWAETPTGDTVYTDGESVKNLADTSRTVMLYAKWSDIFTITFSPGSGAKVNTPSKQVTYGGTYGTLPVPTKSGYYFYGWFTGTNGSGTLIESTGKVNITGNTTLYAKWVRSSSVALKAPPLTSVKSVDYRTITLTWKAVAKAGWYEIYRSVGSSKHFTYYDKTEGNLSYTDIGLAKGTKYYYKVRACYKPYSETVYSSFSSYKYTKPAWPAVTFTAVSQGYDSILVNWNDVAGTAGYKVLRCDTSYKGTYNEITDITNVSQTSYMDEGLTAGHTYYYKVEPYNGTENTLSSYKSAKPVPSAPAGLTLTKSTSTSISISWNTVEGAAGYEIYRATSLRGTYKRVIDTTGSPFENTGLTIGKTYYYKVRAYRIVEGVYVYGGYSEIKSLKLS